MMSAHFDASLFLCFFLCVSHVKQISGIFDKHVVFVLRKKNLAIYSITTVTYASAGLADTQQP